MIIVATMVLGAFCIGSVDAETTDDGTPAVGTETTTYEIQYKVGEEVYSFSGTSQTVTLQSLEQLGIEAPEGETFTGWMQTGTTITVGVGSSVTLKADEPTQFEAQFATTTYTITFVSEGVTVSTATVEHDKPITAPADPVREGYVFEGWNPAVAETATADVTYTAQWREIFDVAWIVDGTRVASGTTESTETLKVPADPEKDAYEFTGWFDAAGVMYTAAYEFTGDTVMTAQFRADTYTVTFVYGEEETVLGTATVEHGETVIAPALPSGYVGWAFDFATPITGDVTIKAIAAEPDEGMSTGMQIGLYIAGVVLVIFAFFAVWGIKTGKIQLKRKS